jgi:excisionase family DNA binding protein
MSAITTSNDIAEIKDFILQQTVLRKDIMTLKEAAVYAGVSANYLYKLTSSRSIPFYRPGSKLIYFKREELDAWLLQTRLASRGELSKI